MKCRNCGSTEVGMYKEIRGIIAEMGITKEDIQKEIKATIDSYIRSATSENITTYIQDSVKTIVRNEIGGNAWGKQNKVQEIVKDCLKDIIMNELKQFDINVSVNERTK